jgi:hypothetical protein
MDALDLRGYPYPQSHHHLCTAVHFPMASVTTVHVSVDRENCSCCLDYHLHRSVEEEIGVESIPNDCPTRYVDRKIVVDLGNGR